MIYEILASHQIAKPLTRARTRRIWPRSFHQPLRHTGVRVAPNDSSIAATIGDSAWHVMLGLRRAAATSPDRSFRSIALPSASACPLSRPSPSLACQCLQPDVSCGQRVVIIFISSGRCEINARKYAPSGPSGFWPYTSMPISPALRRLGCDLLDSYRCCPAACRLERYDSRGLGKAGRLPKPEFTIVYTAFPRCARRQPWISLYLGAHCWWLRRFWPPYAKI